MKPWPLGEVKERNAERFIELLRGQLDAAEADITAAEARRAAAERERVRKEVEQIAFDLERLAEQAYREETKTVEKPRGDTFTKCARTIREFLRRLDKEHDPRVAE